MAHLLVMDGTFRDVGDPTEIGRAGALPLLRVHRGAAGAVVVISAVPATRDGAPMLGNITTLAWGEGALVRAGGLRVGVEWTAAPRRVPAGAVPCRLCFGALVPGEIAVACGCDAPFHVECHALCVTCPACGTPCSGDTTWDR